MSICVPSAKSQRSAICARRAMMTACVIGWCLVVGTGDDDARRRMLEVTDLTLRKAIDICRASESAAAGSTTIGVPAAVSKVSSYRRSRSRAASPGSRSPSVSSTDGRRSARRAGPACLRCGARPHPDGVICPATSRRCHACDQVGHFSAVCPRRTSRGGAGSSPAPARGRARSAGDSLQMSPVVHAGGTSERGPSARCTQHVDDVLRRGHLARRTPRVRLQLRRADGRVVETEWTPDTGAETSALSLRSAEKMGLRGEDLQPPAARLLNADNREMECVGTGSVILQLGNVVKKVDVSVIRGLHSPLLSWHDCMDLGILPAGFPAQIQQVSHGTSHHPSRDQPAAAVTSLTAGGPGSAETPPPAAGLRAGRPGVGPAPGAGVARVSSDGAGEGRAASVAAAHSPAPRTSHPAEAVSPGVMGTGRSPVQPERLVGGTPSAQRRAQQFAVLKAEFPRVFDVRATLRKMVGEPMRIELTDDAVPHALSTARNIPFCWRDDVRQQLDELITKDIIEPVHHPTIWCHPVVPVAKRASDGSVSGCRLTVDFTKLNRFVKRPAHPVRSPQDAVAAITPGARYFTKLDSKAGYHQVPLREEDQDLTCFITPWGSFRYKRAPMGIVSSGDVYNQRGDAALGDLPNTCKVVDDVLAYDTEYDAHLQHVRQILQRCDEHGITLNPEKCRFADSEVEFCGYTINSAGYTADDKKIRAIKLFPKPSNVTDLRSFLGLVNQLGSFSSDVAAAAEPLRQLLRLRNAWFWTPAHDEAFVAVKMALLSPPVLELLRSAEADHPGDRRTFLVYVDRLSGWPFVTRVTGEACARDMVSCLRHMFAATGVPSCIRTDGGPQFSARLTREFFRRWGVDHQQSTPHYPQSNGHAEAAVKAVKRLVQKATVGGDLDTDDFAAGLLELRNTPRADGRSPAQILYGHPLRSAVPAHHRAFAECWQEAADACDARAAKLLDRSVDWYDASARQHRPLRIGQRTLLQDPNSRLWDRTGTITGIGARRDYLVRLPSGRIFWRNRRFLRPLQPLFTGVGADDHRAVPGHDPPHEVHGESGGSTRIAPSRPAAHPDGVGDEGRTTVSTSGPHEAGGSVPPSPTGRPPCDTADVPAAATPECVTSHAPESRPRRPSHRLSVRWSDPVSSEAGLPGTATDTPSGAPGTPPRLVSDGHRAGAGAGVRAVRGPTGAAVSPAAPSHCGPTSQFRANLIARAIFTNLLAMWLNASEIA